MAVKSKEMTASAMKVVIRKHLVCMSLAVKIGIRRSTGGCSLWETEGWGADVPRGKPLVEGSEGSPP